MAKKIKINKKKMNKTKRQAVTKRILESSSSSSEDDFDEYNEIFCEVSGRDYRIVKVFGKTAIKFRLYVAREQMLNGFLKRYNSVNK
ncbi:unnamed protein product [Ceutorhynchus assimilis]|uniref:Uncharacterized protein n=1 Tax=Ceutorhynchus assimilis TaxID=467358 RepID=A0A9P0GQL5_9CUCU|nr:unnamed protein product [Ceutorhynchus assimilis]